MDKFELIAPCHFGLEAVMKGYIFGRCRGNRACKHVP